MCLTYVVSTQPLRSNNSRDEFRVAEAFWVHELYDAQTVWKAVQRTQLFAPGSVLLRDLSTREVLDTPDEYARRFSYTWVMRGGVEESVEVRGKFFLSHARARRVSSDVTDGPRIIQSAWFADYEPRDKVRILRSRDELCIRRALHIFAPCCWEPF